MFRRGLNVSLQEMSVHRIVSLPTKPHRWQKGHCHHFQVRIQGQKADPLSQASGEISARSAGLTGLVSRPACISPYLVFPFQHQQISDLSKGQPQANNLSLIYVVGQLAYMDHAWRYTRAADVTFEFFAVVAIGCKRKQKQIQPGSEQKALVLLE